MAWGVSAQLQAGDSPWLPQVNSEYYTGWLDYWGGPHASTSATLVAQGLADMLQLGANVNMQVANLGHGPSLLVLELGRGQQGGPGPCGC